MIAFPLPSHPYSYRPLRRGLFGWDVFALQSALKGAGHRLILDGAFGTRTHEAVELWQEGKALTIDGIAGIVTQRSLALTLGETVRDRHKIPTKLLMGLIEKESGYLLGNHTAVYPANGSRDLGVVQRNDRFATWEDAFDVHDSLTVLGAQLREKKDEYKAGPKGLSHRRAWELAAGSWNAPAWTNWLAGVRPWAVPNPSNLEWINGYIDRVCTYARAHYGSRRWPV